MTDPRIEAAARALCIEDGHDPDGNDGYVQSGMGANWCAFKENARAALAAADAAAWRPLVKFPPPSNAVLIKSEQGGEKHYAVAEWDLKIDAWRNEDQMYSPRYFTQWQPLGDGVGA